MKRLFLSLMLLFLTISASFAEKTYVTMTVSNFINNHSSTFGSYIELSGDVPSTMRTVYTVQNIPNMSPKAKWAPEWIGYIINLLAKEGFEVEQQILIESNTLMFLFSKTVEPSTPVSKSEDKPND